MNARVAQHNSATRAVRICGHDARLEPENSCGLYLHVLGPFVGPESPIHHATTATWRDLIGFDQIENKSDPPGTVVEKSGSLSG
jgi:hypothetical protein